MLRHINLTLLPWVMRKFKRVATRKVATGRFLERLAKARELFVHWRLGMIGAFA